MKIYEDQLAVLGEARAAEFERRLVQFLREKVAAGTGREVMESEVRARIAEAGAWQLDTEREIAAYVVGAWAFGDAFLARIEPMRGALSRRVVAAGGRAFVLLDALDDQASSLGRVGGGGSSWGIQGL
jgi:hypothetical protein